MTQPHTFSGAAPTRPAPLPLPTAASVAATRPSGPRVALTYGTYDLFHIGHVRLFERIKQQFDHLIVAVSTDEFNAIKGKKSVVPYADRVALVAASNQSSGTCTNASLRA